MLTRLSYFLGRGFDPFDVVRAANLIPAEIKESKHCSYSSRLRSRIRSSWLTTACAFMRRDCRA